MIFVTVGTHEQPFDRLIKEIDRLSATGMLAEEVVIQTGFSTYEPQYCEWKKLYSFQDMERYVSEARIVITHGGPSSFVMPLQVGKIPIVVPRKMEFDEHVNNHQVEFSKAVAERWGTIIVVEEIAKLEEVIKSYDTIVGSMSHAMNSNNAKFCESFEKLVDGMFE